jgi:DNA segregation ATPase FtsK/SpoIIIE-like protein
MARSSRNSADSLRTRSLLAIVLATAAILLVVALAAFLQDGNWRLPRAELMHRMGRLNYLAAWGAVKVFGAIGVWLVPIALAALAARLLAGRALPGTDRRSLLLVAAATILASTLSALPGGDLPAERTLVSGWLGAGLVRGLRALFGEAGTVVFLVGTSGAFLAAVGIPVLAPLRRLSGPAAALAARAGEAARAAVGGLREAFAPPVRPRREPAPAVRIVETSRRPSPAARVAAAPGEQLARASDELFADEPGGEADGAEAPSLESIGGIPDDVPVVVLPSRGEPARAPRDTPVALIQEIQSSGRPYVAPPLEFLARDEEAEDVREKAELLEGAKVLERALQSFGVKGKVTQVQPGPVITRYEIEPAPGQKVAPIANLTDDLALVLKARQIRIVAPIPGKAAVGIEVPNDNARTVRLGPLLESPEFLDDDSPLTIALGRTISGDPFCVALDRLPHVLVAGATGAGKSVCINSLITSMIYRAGPEDVRFVMIDPKMLELTTYVGLPHLIPPVVSQPKDIVRILKWAVGEMETRYRALAHLGVRSIVDYNKRQVKEGAPKLPYLVVIIDELADLMLSSSSGEIEEAIARLAQMARAVGIHLVLATQRPSVDVITGVIKANFPSRVAFQVPTRTDSRTILDSIGAERLLGKGDMLYLGTGMAEPVRIHGAYISTEETTDIVEWLKTRNPAPEAEDGEAGPLGETDDLFPYEREDDLFEEASRILVAHQQGSISLLQRRLKVGYARAARLVDMMEEAGIVGPFTGSKAREILVPTLEELEKKLAAAKSAPLGG